MNERTAGERLTRVAVLVDTSTTWGRDVISGVHQYSRGCNGWQLFVEPRGVEQRRWLSPDWRGEGVIARVGLPDLATSLRKLEIPVVNVSGIVLPKVNFPRVVSDLTAAACLAAEHLISRGFRNFGYFSLLGLEYVAEHQQAFDAAVRLAGHRCDVYGVHPRIGAEPDWNLDLERLGSWLKQLPKPLAVFTWNSSSARELIFACNLAGLSVPEEVAVLSGAEDELFCEIAPVPISAVQLGAKEIGFRAAAQLDRMMNHPELPFPQETFVAPRGIVERRSTDILAIDDQSVAKALRFIRSNLSRPIQVPDVARHAGLCRRALEQRFNEHVGRTPAAEIRRVRLNHAIELLQRTELPVAEVAECSGFGSPEYMASVFKAQFGCTPLDCRRPAHFDAVKDSTGKGRFMARNREGA
ncbi:MAG: DNA-binding transcriptional regulator [Verrucomicrobiae bacterium]|nr:DNA-binding transcriptional regulator [Verrucomicrobiae bacterium]